MLLDYRINYQRRNSFKNVILRNLYKFILLRINMHRGVMFTAIIIVFLGVIFLGFSVFNSAPKPDNTDIISFDNSIGIDDEGGFGTGEDSIVQENPKTYTIEITSSGFSPNTLEINFGDVVTFINQGSSSSWPASAIHPTHTLYPNSGINKCGTTEEINILDACQGLANGETYSFTFNEVGTWNYHDHLRPNMKGTIIVN